MSSLSAADAAKLMEKVKDEQKREYIEKLFHQQKMGKASKSSAYVVPDNIPTSYGTPDDPPKISNNTPPMQLNCIECGIAKSNSEDLETHIKLEHLNWLPFQCPICLAGRASDALMREHLHSSHKKEMNKFIYVDNLKAKQQLQQMMDKAFSMNVTRRVNATTNSVQYSPNSQRGSNPNSGRSTATGTNGTNASNAQAAAAAILQQHQENEKKSFPTTPAEFMRMLEESMPQVSSSKTKNTPTTSSTSNNGSTRKRPFVPTSATESITTTEIGTTESLLASINASAAAAAATVASIGGQVEENEENDKPGFSLEDLNIDSSNALASLFGNSLTNKVKYEDDGEVDVSMEDALDALNPISVLDNVAALFTSSTPSERVIVPDEPKKTTSSTSKKRVLGECSKCQKPVTAGARQMHMFFHLAKDENIFRFRCKHDGCSIEHYRKDQMENHQSKIHGRIDPDMMEDRSLELFQKCQELNHELFVAHRLGGQPRASQQVWSNGTVADVSYQDLSMELLGTKNGTVPGPTAAKAEIAYAAQQALNAQRNAHRNKPNGGQFISSIGGTNGGPLRLVPDEDHPLQCRLCGKTMQNRIRGFHILWHMAKDKGINRYTCKYCKFGHDRSQSVQVHGKKEHGTDECVEDRIGDYQEDVKEMSEACFGTPSLFAQESKRKNKIPAAIPREKEEEESSISGNASPLILLDEDIDAEAILKTIKEAVNEGAAESEEMEGVVEEGDEAAEEAAEETNEDDDQNEEDDEVEEDEEVVPVAGSAKRKKRGGRFNTRSRKSKKQKEEASVMRNISMLIGGAQFYRKKVNEFCYCEKCGKQINSRLPEHAYTHMKAQLFYCPICEVGHQCRETVLKHMKDMHPDEGEKCQDARLSHISEIKDAIKECFPAFFIDHPLPTRADVAKLLEMSKSGEVKLGGVQEYLEKLNDGVEPVDEE